MDEYDVQHQFFVTAQSADDFLNNLTGSFEGAFKHSITSGHVPKVKSPVGIHQIQSA